MLCVLEISAVYPFAVCKCPITSSRRRFCLKVFTVEIKRATEPASPYRASTIITRYIPQRSHERMIAPTLENSPTGAWPPTAVLIGRALCWSLLMNNCCNSLIKGSFG